MTMRLRGTLTVLTMLAIGAPVSAQTVFNNGAPNSQAGWDIFNDYRAADDFRFTGTLSFDLIRFWGLLPTGFNYAPNIFWEILNDGGAGTPGTSVASGNVLAQPTLRTSISAFGFDSWQFDLSVGPQSLGPGIYWLALHDGPLSGITDSTLLWETTGLNSGYQFAVQLIPTAEWSGDFGGDLAFDLRNSALAPAVVPEPFTVVLLGTGLLALGLVHRRRRSRLSESESQS
jgi:hypothetical protein